MAFYALAGTVTCFGDFVYRGTKEYAEWQAAPGDYTGAKPTVRKVYRTFDIEFRRDLGAARETGVVEAEEKMAIVREYAGAMERMNAVHSFQRTNPR